MKPARKFKLKEISYQVRVSQLILQYGVGAMIDFPNQTLMVAHPKYWEEATIEIEDERLAKALGVEYFGMPFASNNRAPGVAYVLFPRWYFCPKCRHLKPIEDWMKEFKQSGYYQKNKWMTRFIRYPHCSSCKQRLIVTNIVTVCSNGHIDDFPWVQWVHYKNFNPSARLPCHHPKLKFISNPSSEEGLPGIIIRCVNCDAQATLKDAFDPEIFARMANQFSTHDFTCSGFHPWKNEHEECQLYPRAVQRSSSSVYFPVIVSSLVIPPYSNKINVKIQNSKRYKEIRAHLKYVREECDESLYQAHLQKAFPKYVAEIATEIGVKAKSVDTILRRKWLEQPKGNPNSLQYRMEEYDALTGKVKYGSYDEYDFLREEMDLSRYAIPFIKQMVLIHKIREVEALLGFTRLVPIYNAFEDHPYVKIINEDMNWYPAYEVRGEGIFIEFDHEAIKRWEQSDGVINRLAHGYGDKVHHKNRLTAKFILLHTLAHLLIKQLSFECGYNIASLKERIYSSDEEDGAVMSGILIYTASGDAEGTLGGLVRQGRPDIFPAIFQRAIQEAQYCSNDPVCILSNGQGRDSLNLAACHACALLPETSCEEHNVFLDRAFVVGTFENLEIGFYRRYIDSL